MKKIATKMGAIVIMIIPPSDYSCHKSCTMDMIAVVMIQPAANISSPRQSKEMRLKER